MHTQSQAGRVHAWHGRHAAQGSQVKHTKLLAKLLLLLQREHHTRAFDTAQHTLHAQPHTHAFHQHVCKVATTCAK